jgi:hypothetical protein
MRVEPMQVLENTALTELAELLGVDKERPV